VTEGSVPGWFRRTLHDGMAGADVDVVRRMLGMGLGGYDADVAVRVRGVQRSVGLPMSGVVDSETAVVFGETATSGMTPDWFVRDLAYGDTGDDVAALRYMLGLEEGDLFDRRVEDAVRRFESENRVVPTGVVDENLAIEIGE